MGKKFLIDTNVLIDAQMGRLSENGLKFLLQTINENFIISFITLIEFLGYKDVANSSKEFISMADVLGIDNAIIQTCIDLRKNYTIKLPDAIIAATALTNNLTLITNNDKDFDKIQNLNIINPYSF